MVEWDIGTLDAMRGLKYFANKTYYSLECGKNIQCTPRKKENP